jgi:hypothetical protein
MAVVSSFMRGENGCSRSQFYKGKDIKHLDRAVIQTKKVTDAEFLF